MDQMKGKNLDSRSSGRHWTESGVTEAETDSLFAMMDDIGATDLEAERDLHTSAQTEETVSGSGKTDYIPIRLRGYPDLKTLVKDLPKIYFLEQLLNYPQFHRQTIYYAVQAIRSRSESASVNKN